MSARDTQIVEVRLARLQALVQVMKSVGLRERDFPGDIDVALGWLRMMAVEGLSEVKAVLCLKVTNRDC